jgi:microcin C transport system substrate-binding protein
MFQYLKVLSRGILCLCIMGQVIHAQDAMDTQNQTLINSHGLSLFGKLKYDKNFTHFDYVNPDAPKGGKVTLSAIGGFDDFNPYNGKGEVAAGVGLLYDKLLQRAYDEAGSEYGLIAEKIIHPQDYSWVEYHLRPEATFSDGHPITADDVVFSFNILREKGDPLYRYYYANIKSVSKVNDQAVKFTFDMAGNRELPLITGQLPILPKHYWEKRDFTKVSLDIPVVSGQYIIDSFEPNRTVIYKRNPNYWAKNLPIRKGTHNFDTIKYELYRDSSVAFEAFKAGEFDYYTEISAKNWAKGYDFSAFKNGKVKKSTFSNLNPKPFQGLVFNLRRTLFQNPALRQALNLNYDFKWLNKKLFYNAYAETNSFFEKSQMAATGKPSQDELDLLNQFKDDIPTALLTRDIDQKPCNDNRQCSRLARKILKQAGYVYKQGKLYTPNNQPVKFEILNTSPALERVLLPMVAKMKKIGIQANVRTMDTAQYIRRLNNFDYDAIVGMWAQSPSPGNEQREYWSTAAASRQGSRNYAGITDKAIDGMIEKLIFSTDRKTLVTTAKVLDRLLRYKQFAIPMWHSPHDRIAYWDKFGLPPQVKSYGAGNSILFWWSKK